MSNNAQKLPFARSLNQFAEEKVQAAVNAQNTALPCSVVAVSGSIVTVKFEVTGVYTLPNVTIPVFGPQYIRYPIQVGDLGVVIPCDAYIGNASGLGGSGASNLTQPGNLSALVFFPIGNAHWSAPDDVNAVIVYGPDGVVIRDTASLAKIVLKPASIVMSLGSTTVTVSSAGVAIVGNVTVTGTIHSTGDMTAGTVTMETHVHGGVYPGSSYTTVGSG